MHNKVMNKAFWQEEAPAESKRERRKQEIRAKVIEAAIHLFEENGFEETNLEQICEKAEISRPTFYSYYNSKQDLIQALSEKRWLALASEIKNSSMTQHESTQEFIQSFFELTRIEIAKYGSLERELIRFSMSRDNTEDGENSRLLKAMTAMFFAMYTEGRKRGDIGNRYPIDFLAETTMGCITSVMINWAYDPKYPIERMLEQTSDFIDQMLMLEA